MTDRIPLAQHTKASLDQLYDNLDQARILADPELHGRLTAAINALGKSETELANLRADVTRIRALVGRWVKAGPPPLGVPIARWWDTRLAELHGAIHAPAEEAAPAATEATERPTLRERHRAQWLALTDAERAARIAALDKDDEPEHPARTTPDNPATSDGTPPAHTSVNAENCPACTGTNPDYPFICPGGYEAATEATDVGTEFVQQADHPDEGALARVEADLAAAEPAPPQRPGVRDDIADATVPLLLDTLPKVIARARGYEVADAVLTLLYREWPWLRAAAEERAGLANTLAATTKEQP